MAQVTSEPSTPAPDMGPSVEISQQVIGRSPWELFWRRFRKDGFAIAGLIIIAIMLILAIFAPLTESVTNHGKNQVFLDRLDSFGIPTGPQGDFWFGLDTAGRDMFVRVIYGARTSLIIAFFATGLATLIGVILGLFAGFYRGRVDTVISRTVDVWLSLPVLLLALGLAAACGLEPCLGGLIQPGLLVVSLIIGLFNWPYICRIVRGQVLSLREKEFTEAARGLGSTNRRIMLRELLPNGAAPT